MLSLGLRRWKSLLVPESGDGVKFWLWLGPDNLGAGSQQMFSVHLIFYSHSLIQPSLLNTFKLAGMVAATVYMAKQTKTFALIDLTL